jgi:carboxypeptidase Q
MGAASILRASPPPRHRSFRVQRPRTVTSVLGSLALLLSVALPGSAQDVDAYRDVANRLIDAATANHDAYARLGDLVDGFGSRLSGSTSLENAIDWILREMDADGLQNVHAETAMVPHWVRGEESAELVLPRHRKLPMLGLGGSVATPPGGIRAQVLVVSSFDELTARAGDARGRIVLFDVPFTNYGETVQYRTNGAVAAARVGAVASLIRSVASASMQSPHTGAMRYEEGVAKIPHAAITVEDAQMLHRMQDRGERIEVLLKMQAQTLPDSPSRNVMGEVTGSEHPEEVVVLGGHVDSWDVGQGAMDDGGGVVAAWEAVRLIKALGLKPRRTIRVVGWVNEENGGAGGRQYAADHAGEKHVLAIESDGGVFAPQGFGFTGSDAAFSIVSRVGRLLERIGAGDITRGGGGADIGPLMQTGVPGMGLEVDGTRYFWYHHSDADTLDKLDPDEVARCVAAMAVVAFVVADLPEALPR